MHRPTLSLFVLIGLLSGGLLGTSTVCGQLPNLGDHCGGIIPFVDDDPWFPYAYPSGPRADGNRMAERSSPWQFYQAGCDPVYDQAVYGSTSDEWAVPLDSPPQTVAATPATAQQVASDDDEYVDFPYELTYDDDPQPATSQPKPSPVAAPSADHPAEPEEIFREEDSYEHAYGDDDAEVDEYDYEYDGYDNDEYAPEEYDDDYEYEYAYGYDEVDSVEDEGPASESQADQATSDRLSEEKSTHTQSSDAEDAYRQYDEYYDEYYEEYYDEYEDYEDLSAAVDPAPQTADLTHGEPDLPSDAGAQPAQAKSSDDEYVDFPYELSYDDDVADETTAHHWQLDDLSCRVSDIRDRVLAWICETGIEDSVARARIVVQGTAAQVASSLPRVLESMTRPSSSPAAVQPRQAVADAVDARSDSNKTVHGARARREARIRAALWLDQIGESLQRISRQMMVEIAREDLESFQR